MNYPKYKDNPKYEKIPFYKILWCVASNIIWDFITLPYILLVMTLVELKRRKEDKLSNLNKKLE